MFGLVLAAPMTGEASQKFYDFDVFLGPAPVRPAVVPPVPTPAPPPMAADVPRPGRPTALPPTGPPPAPREAPPGDRGPGDRGIVSELRLGLLLHSVDAIATGREGGIHISPEILFAAPRWLDSIGAPRPLVGAEVNAADTSYLYAGLVWNWPFLGRWLAEAGLAGAIHDGHLESAGDDATGHGCRLLMRLAAGLGAEVAPRHVVSLHFEHYTNAGLCDPDQGNDTLGVRYGYRL